MPPKTLSGDAIQKGVGKYQNDYGVDKVIASDKAVKKGVTTGPLVLDIPIIVNPAHTAAAKKNNDATVGILGAGPGGLYAGLILDSLDIDYEILEANDRVGGRLLTHHFSDEPYDYYDLGAMRFPETPIMKRVFDLFKYDKLKAPDGVQIDKKRIEYFFDCKDKNGIQYYNGRRKRLNAETVDPDFFMAAEVGVDDVYIKAGRDKIYADVIGPFVKLLLKDMTEGGDEGWKNLMGVDSHSTRSYMTHTYVPSAEFREEFEELPENEGLPTDVVNWMETYSMTTSWFDRAFATTILEEMAFGYGSGTGGVDYTPKFSCFDGGSDILTTSMANYIDSKTDNKGILKKHRVTGISIANRDVKGTSPLLVDYVVDKVEKPTAEDIAAGKDKDIKGIKKYDHVISTLPIPVLHHAVDLDNAELTAMQTNALRLLQYTPATKIGIKFKSAWWTKGKDKDGNPILDREGKTLDIVGGRSFTDRPIRIVVYPSYGLERDGTAVLIASFIWTDDAARMGALIGSGSTNIDEQLKAMVLQDLSLVHNIDLEILQDQYISQYSVDWADNPRTMGAFALFGPGKFGSVYPSLTVPAGRGKLHFAGEAISIRHGWVVGALDSVWRSIFEYLLVSEQAEKLVKFIELWDLNEEWFRGVKEGGTDWKNALIVKHLGAQAPDVFELMFQLKEAKEEEERAIEEQKMMEQIVELLRQQVEEEEAKAAGKQSESAPNN